MEDNLLTMQEVMARLKVGYNTLIRYINSGVIPIVKISRNKRLIKESDLNKFLDSCHVIRHIENDNLNDIK